MLPISWMYGFVVWIRNCCYDFRIFRVHRVGVPVISVGNLTTGGTGKTPLVEYLVKYFIDRNKKVAVISRGYKRTTKGMMIVSNGCGAQVNVEMSGDEAYQVAEKYPQSIVIVDEYRARASMHAIEKFKVDLIILDDGFQHRSLHRDIDIAMIDGEQSFWKMNMLPAGMRREPLRGLNRATVIVFSGNPVDENFIDEVKQTFNKTYMKAIFCPTSAHKFIGESLIPLSYLNGKKCIAFCGIGNSNSFLTTLRELNLQILDFVAYPDHHRFSIEELRNIKVRFDGKKADLIITTEKDSVRILDSGQYKGFPFDVFFYVQIETKIIEGEDKFHQIIESMIQS
ncbi:MAG TPA: tetraacyldisaccharide 4'-kinase [Bacteroidota bacterium]|nr:tetraacyldisaccharide 4'-kinase [Bacteroidota bacterium]